MQFALDVNRELATRVEKIVKRYEVFTHSLRGAVADFLSGLADGTRSFLSVARELDQLKNSCLHAIADAYLQDARAVSVSALELVQAFDAGVAGDEALKVAGSLENGFYDSVLGLISEQMSADIRVAENYIRAQLTQGRFFASTKELRAELEFAHVTRAGRRLDSLDYVRREVNWSLRQLHNHVVIFALSTRGHEQGRVVGGSKDGDVIELDQYDKLSPTYFHHNSKSILSPNYSVS